MKYFHFYIPTGLGFSLESYIKRMTCQGNNFGVIFYDRKVVPFMYSWHLNYSQLTSIWFGFSAFCAHSGGYSPFLSHVQKPKAKIPRIFCAFWDYSSYWFLSGWPKMSNHYRETYVLNQNPTDVSLPRATVVP